MTKVLLASLFAVSMWGADVTGRWSGVIEVNDPSSGDKINTQVRAEFSQKPDSISGKIGRKEDEESQPIRNARLDGNTLVFEVRPQETAGAIKFNLVLVSDNRIEGDMKGAIDIGPIAGKVKLTREAKPQ